MSIWTRQDLQFLEDNYIDMRYQDIAKYIDKTESAVKAKCRYMNLQKRKSYTVNETFFDTWSNDMAYLLGFIMADGCVSYNTKKSKYNMRLCIHPRDISVINFANSLLCPDNYIYYYPNSELCQVRYTSKHMAERLISLGVIPNKTGYENMTHVPDEWKPAWIRGMFDGDGSISIRKDGKNYSCYICSQSKLLMDQLYEYFDFGVIVDVSKYKPRYKTSFYNWLVRKKCYMEIFRNTIYNGGFSLDRKRDRMFLVNTAYKVYN